jgi:ubiquitin-conjugating enzyme E2 J2
MLSTVTTKRLMKEYEDLKTSNPVNFVAEFNKDNILEWHFCLFGLDDDQYRGGIYHGKIIFPPAYPNKPPSIMMITPSGRFTPKQRICLTMSDFHPETWTPAWRFESIVYGLISFMLTEEHSVSSIHESLEARKTFAKKSLEWNLKNETD